MHKISLERHCNSLRQWQGLRLGFGARCLALYISTLVSYVRQLTTAVYLSSSNCCDNYLFRKPPVEHMLYNYSTCSLRFAVICGEGGGVHKHVKEA